MVSMNRLAQFSMQLVSLLDKYVPGELTHFSKQTSVKLAIICCTWASCCSRSRNACISLDGPLSAAAIATFRDYYNRLRWLADNVALQ